MSKHSFQLFLCLRSSHLWIAVIVAHAGMRNDVQNSKTLLVINLEKQDYLLNHLGRAGGIKQLKNSSSKLLSK